MACVQFEYRGTGFNEWRGVEIPDDGVNNFQASRYKAYQTRNLHLPQVTMYICDYLTLDWSRNMSRAGSYGYTDERMEEWTDIFSNDLIDSEGNTIVCSQEYYLTDLGDQDKRWGQIWTHGETAEFFTISGDYYPVKDNFYPFYSSDRRRFFNYYGKDYSGNSEYYLGDVYYLNSKTQDGIDDEDGNSIAPMLPDGDEGGYFYGEWFNVYIAFGSIVEYRQYNNYIRFWIKGTYSPFNVYNIGADSNVPRDLPCPKSPLDINGYYQNSTYIRVANPNGGSIGPGRPSDDQTFYCDSSDYEYFVDVIEKISEGKQAYADEYGPFGAQPNRKQLAKQSPYQLLRAARRKSH